MIKPERVYLDRPLMKKCYRVACARNDAKPPDSPLPYEIDTPNHHRHFAGLRNEAAFGELIEKPHLVDYSVQRWGDGGVDMVLGGSTIQLKSSSYDPPYLRFEIEGNSSFTADIAILGLVPKLPYDPKEPKKKYPEWFQDNNWVDLYGWIRREEFLAQAQRMDLKHGERLVIKNLKLLRPIQDFLIYR